MLVWFCLASQNSFFPSLLLVVESLRNENSSRCERRCLRTQVIPIRYDARIQVMSSLAAEILRDALPQNHL